MMSHPGRLAIACCALLLASCGLPGAAAPPTISSSAAATGAPASATPVGTPSPTRPAAAATRGAPGGRVPPSVTAEPASLDLSRAQPLAVQFAPPPPGDGPPLDLTDVHFVTPREGFGATNSSGIYRTSDGGASWRQLYRLDGARFDQVRFGDAATGLALGRQGCLPGPNCTGPTVLLSTIDGGNTWQAIQPNGPTREIAEDLPGLNIAVVSAEVSYAVRDPNGWLGESSSFIANRKDGVLATGDGGRRWRMLPLPDGFRPGTGLSFLSPNRGTSPAGARTRGSTRSWRRMMGERAGGCSTRLPTSP